MRKTNWYPAMSQQGAGSHQFKDSSSAVVLPRAYPNILQIHDHQHLTPRRHSGWDFARLCKQRTA